MILCVDVDYRDGNSAAAAGVAFVNWLDKRPAAEYTAHIDKVEEYVPGAFYKRELPCILSVLDKVDQKIDTIIIDGYVWLGNDRAPGLGEHLSRALNHGVPIIGVSKSKFRNAPEITEIRRGASNRPLYITARGMDLEDAKMRILNMHGEHRLPALIKLADRLCREA